jgi:hypothetical protein
MPALTWFGEVGDEQAWRAQVRDMQGRYRIQVPLMDKRGLVDGVALGEGYWLARVTGRRANMAALDAAGRYLFKEEGYDFALSGLVDDTHEPWLFTTDDGMVIGAAQFALETQGWVLEWVWLHPFKRRRGILHRTWPIWRQRYGRFHPRRPLSTAMQGFVAKHP